MVADKPGPPLQPFLVFPAILEFYNFDLHLSTFNNQLNLALSVKLYLYFLLLRNHSIFSRLLDTLT